MSLWRTRSDRRQELARAELVAANEDLEEARSLRELSEALSVSLREIRARNHITPSIFPPEGKKT